MILTQKNKSSDLLTEIKFLKANMNEPHIVKMIDYCRPSELEAMIVMERIRGNTLENLNNNLIRNLRNHEEKRKKIDSKENSRSADLRPQLSRKEQDISQRHSFR